MFRILSFSTRNSLFQCFSWFKHHFLRSTPLRNIRNMIMGKQHFWREDHDKYCHAVNIIDDSPIIRLQMVFNLPSAIS